MKSQYFIDKMKLVKVYRKMNLKDHDQLIKQSWKLYLESFPDGYATFVRDFDKQTFTEVLVSSNYIKFIRMNNSGEVISFALISNDEKCLVEASSVDPETLKKKFSNTTKKIYWIFIFMTKEKANNAVATVPLAGKMFQYIFDNNGVAGFSMDIDEVPTLKKQIKFACKLVLGIELDDKDICHEVTTIMYPK